MASAHRVTAIDVLQIVDIRRKIVSLSSFAVGTAYAVSERHTLEPGAFARMRAATLCVDSAATRASAMRGISAIFIVYTLAVLAGIALRAWSWP